MNLDAEPEKCIVCYCDFEDGEKCIQLHCKHLFHPDCIIKWLEKNPLCPVCKQDSLGRRREQAEEERRPPRGFHRIVFQHP